MWSSDPTLRFLYAHLEPCLGHAPPRLPVAKHKDVYHITFPGGLLEVRLKVEEGLLVSYQIDNLAQPRD